MFDDDPDRLPTRAVLFDFYNTLVNVRTDEYDPEVWVRLARFLRYHGLGAEPGELRSTFDLQADEARRRSLEPNFQTDIAAVFEEILRDLGAPDPVDLRDEVMWAFRTLSMHYFELFPDAIDTLTDLRDRGFKTGVVTDAQVLFVGPELKMLGLADLLDVVVVSGNRGIHKPDSRLFREALEQLGFASYEAVYVGDNLERDVMGAQDAEIRAVLVDRCGRFDLSSALCKPDIIVRQLSDLGGVLTLQETRAFRLTRPYSPGPRDLRSAEVPAGQRF